ncbi:lipid-A-disaccharide synthase [uncultured Roseibium sp.]|uniref:lipid-A-disaccharide synthase n=1 Tax=uncultured Roseibium sp. TaxID=1936171 RepID=UPI0032177B53
MSSVSLRRRTICIVVGEESGDLLGSELILALKGRLGDEVTYCGVGGERMKAAGFRSFFDMSDIAVMGMTAVLARLPLIVKRVYQTVARVIAAKPDVLIIIDSPDFTHNVAKRVRKRAPDIPIIGYVSPSVWAWRSGRARKMSVYVDELLALLPFEPEVHDRLGGPRTHYVGHPIIERVERFRPKEGERTPVSSEKKVLLVLPGSRGSEVDRLLADFGTTVARLDKRFDDLEVLLPAVPHMVDRIRRDVADWPLKPEIVIGEDAKHAAFRRAHAALAASGTVSLELALAGVPMAICYKLDWFYRRLKDLNKVIQIVSATSMVLPNIILGRNVVPEFLDEEVNADRLEQVVADLLTDSEVRRVQIEAFRDLDHLMRLPDDRCQSAAAADVVMECLERREPVAR